MLCPEKINNIGFIVHPGFGKAVEDDLKAVAKAVGAEGKNLLPGKSDGHFACTFIRQRIV
jgi:hypothetical protein